MKKGIEGFVLRFGTFLTIALLIPALVFAQEEEAKELMMQVTDRIVAMIQFIGFLLAIIGLSYAGILWMRGGEDPESREKAKSVIQATIVGAFLLIVGPLLAKWLFAGFI